MVTVPRRTLKKEITLLMGLKVILTSLNQSTILILQLNPNHMPPQARQANTRKERKQNKGKKKLVEIGIARLVCINLMFLMVE
jgi:hypothetical protein